MANDGSFGDVVRMLTELAGRVAALEQKAAVRTDRIVYLLACHQKLRDIRDDLIAADARLSVLPPLDAESKRRLLRNLQTDLDAPRLPEVDHRHLVGFLECLRHIDILIREELLKSPDVFEWAARKAIEELSDFWRRAEDEGEVVSSTGK